MSTQPPTTCLSIFCAAIHATRAAMSDSGLDTGRVGFAPGKGERERTAVLDLPDVGKLRGILADRGQKIRRHQMGVAIDNHSSSFFARRGDQVAEL